MLPPLSEFRLEIPDHVVSRLVDGATILLDVHSGRTFSLDAVATRAWEVLTAASSAQAGVDALAAEYEADPRIVARDVAVLVERLADGGLVDVHGL